MIQNLFFVYLCFLIALNREFAYWHISFMGWSVYITEVFLALTTLGILYSNQAKHRITESRLGKNIFFWIGLFLALIAFKLFQIWPTWTMESLREVALAYYSVAVIIPFVISSTALRSARFQIAVLLCALLGTGIFLAKQTGHLQTAIWIDHFHGFPSLLWMGFITCWLWNSDDIDYRYNPAKAVLFALFTVTAFTMGGRSIATGLLGVFAFLGVCQFETLSRPAWRTVLVSLSVAMLVVLLRLDDVIQFNSQNVWKQSFNADQLLGALQTTPTASMTPPAVLPVLQSSRGEVCSPYFLAPKISLPQVNSSISPTIVYKPEERYLFLESKRFGPEYLRQKYSSKTNNALWRLELWRLSMEAVVRYHPWLGFPLGTRVDFFAFNDPRTTEWLDLHNSHLAYIFRFGIVGFVIYLGLIGRILWTFWSGWKRTQNVESLSFFAAGLYGLWLAAFNVTLEGPYAGMAFWLWMGIGLVRTSKTE